MAVERSWRVSKIRSLNNTPQPLDHGAGSREETQARKSRSMLEDEDQQGVPGNWNRRVFGALRCDGELS